MQNREANPNSNKLFTTSNVDVAAYLLLEGLKYLSCSPSQELRSGKPLVNITFLDEKGVARDLERVFMGSREKVYRDYLKYLLKQIHECARGVG